MVIKTPKRKPRQVEPDDESLPYIQGVGSVTTFTEVPEENKPVEKDQIGFVRQKKKKDATTRLRMPRVRK